MLVVTRRNGESFFVSPDVEIRVLGVKGGQVRIGVEAPKTLAIYREELKEQFEGSTPRIVVVPAGAEESTEV